MATPTNPTRPKSGKKSPTGGVGGMDSGILVKIAWDINQAVESGKKLEKSVKDIAVETSKTTKSIEAQLTKMTAVFTQSVEGMAGKFDSALEKIDKKLQSAATRSAKKVRDTVKQASDDVKHLAEEGAKATEANDATVDKASENTRKNLKETDKEVNKVRDSFNSLRNIIKKIGSGIGPALAQGLTASFSFFFGMLNRLKEYDTFLGQLHTKITNTSKELTVYQNTLLDQTVVRKDELSFGLTPEQRREAMGTFATFASEQEKYSSKTGANIKGLTEGASGMLKGIGIPIGEASAALMDLHKKTGLAYAEMEKFSLGMTAVYRRSNMTTDQFKKMLDILPNIAKAYDMGTKASQEFVGQSLRVGSALSSAGLNAEEMIGKMNRLASGSEEGLIQAMVLGLNPSDQEGNLKKFQDKAQEIVQQTSGMGIAAPFMQAQMAKMYGMDMTPDQIQMLANGGTLEDANGLRQQTPEENLKATAEALKDVATKYERPFVTMDQQISQFFAEAEARIVRKFSNAIGELKVIFFDFGKKIKEWAEYIDKLTGGPGGGLGKLAGASLIAGMIAGPLVSGVIRAITSALNIEKLGQTLLRVFGMGRFAPMFAGTAARGAAAATPELIAARSVLPAVRATLVAMESSAATSAAATAAGIGLAGKTLMVGIASASGVYIGRFLDNLSKQIWSQQDLDKFWDGVLEKSTKLFGKVKEAFNSKRFQDTMEMFRVVGDTLWESVKEIVLLPLTVLKKINKKVYDKAMAKINAAFSATNKEAVDTARTAVDIVKGAVGVPASSGRSEVGHRDSPAEDPYPTTFKPRASTGQLKQEQMITKGFVEASAKLRGVDSDYASATAELESSFDPNAKNPSPDSTAKGLYGFTDSTWKRYGKGSATDIEEATEAFAKLTKENAERYGLNPEKLDLKQAQILRLAHMGTGTLEGNDWIVGKGDKKRNAYNEFNAEVGKVAALPQYSGQEGFKTAEEVRRAAQELRWAKMGRDQAHAVQQASAAKQGKDAKATEAKTADIVPKGPKYNLTVMDGNRVIEAPRVTSQQVGQDTTAIAKAASAPEEDRAENIRIIEPDPNLAATPAKPVTSAIEKPALPTKVEDSAAVKNVHDTATYQVLTRIESLLRETQNTKPADIDIFQSKNDWRFYQQNANNSLAGVTS